MARIKIITPKPKKLVLMAMTIKEARKLRDVIGDSKYIAQLNLMYNELCDILRNEKKNFQVGCKCDKGSTL